MTVLFILPKTVSFLRNKSCSCTTCIVYVNLFKDRFFYVGFLFRKADAKVKTFKYIFQMFSEVFFHSAFSKGEFQKETSPKQKKYVRVPTPFLSECQNIAASVLESGCKSRTL